MNKALYKYCAFFPLVNQNHLQRAGVSVLPTPRKVARGKTKVICDLRHVFPSNTEDEIWDTAFYSVLVPILHSVLPAQTIAYQAYNSSKQLKIFASVGWMFPTLVFHKMLIF